MLGYVDIESFYVVGVNVAKDFAFPYMVNFVILSAPKEVRLVRRSPVVAFLFC